MINLIYIIWTIVISVLVWIAIYDRYFQTKNLVYWNFPLVWRFRYVAHELRPFVRQYFLDDNDFTNRLVIDWILNVSAWKTGYFSFDKFDSSWKLHNWEFGMIHSSTPLNSDEMNVKYPLIWEKRKLPLQFWSYIYRSAMSLWALWFEATSAMAAGCADIDAPFNTWEWGFAIQHIPRVKFSFDRKYFKYKKIPKIFKLLYILAPWKRLKDHFEDLFWKFLIKKWRRDLYLFDYENFLFYAIDWEAPLEVFPKEWDKTKEFWNIIFQIGSSLYGLRKHTEDWSIEFNWNRFQKISSFCSAIEIKLAQWAKQSWGILKANKNTDTISEIRWIKPHIDLLSPNRFPFYNKWKEKEFFDFIEELSEKSSGKPVWIKLVISDSSNIEPIAKQLAKNPSIWPDFITIDWWDWGSWAAPIYLSIPFWKRIYEALEITNKILEKHKVRNNVKIFASAKLYTPYMSAKALALWADAIWNARSIMISAGCIRAWLCSWENWTCPVWLATMKKSKRRAYKQAWDKKIKWVTNFIHAHNKWLIQVSSIAWVDSPDKLNKKHLPKN